MTFKHRIYLVFSLLILLGSKPALAQQSTSATPIREEIVVTARRREENLQDLPLSIVAMGADAMQSEGIFNSSEAG